MPDAVDVQEIPVKNWEVFDKLCGRLDVAPPGDIGYLFRGQSNAAWDLRPSFARRCLRSGLDESRALDVEKIALREFRSVAHMHISANAFTTTTDTISWWTLMQHHGAPTRLLDWGASPYVAAYFAAIGDPDTNGAVWLVHVHTIDDAMDKEFGRSADAMRNDDEIDKNFLQPGQPPVLLFVSRKNKSERQAAQQGLFSLSRQVLTDHATLIAKCCDKSAGKIHFAKIIIPADEKLPFLWKLRQMNITAQSLFPGLDGVARSVDEFIQIRGRPGK